MKALRLHEYTGITGIRLDELPMPEPGENEVRIAVEAFSLNYGGLKGEGNLAEQILQCSNQQGARIIYDPVGGKIVQEYDGGLAQNAEIFLYGGIDPSPTILPEIEMTQKAACLRPFSVFNHIYDADSRRPGVGYISKAIASNAFRPHVDRIYSLADYKQAFDDQVRASARRGKLVVSCL